MRKTLKRTSNSKSTRKFSKWSESVMSKSRNTRRTLKVSPSGGLKGRRRFSS